MVALSFVRNSQDILYARGEMRKRGASIPIIAKIEKHEAVDQLDGILENVDGIMVARGDLGLEIAQERIPAIQKMMIREANHLGKPVITATQMLRSMVWNPRPTRAEVADIANAILDGTDALMLSEETAVGDYPLDAVKTMARVAEETEQILEPRQRFKTPEKTIPEAIVCALSCPRACAQSILDSDTSGSTARLTRAIFRQRSSRQSERQTVKMLCLVLGFSPCPQRLQKHR